MRNIKPESEKIEGIKGMFPLQCTAATIIFSHVKFCAIPHSTSSYHIAPLRELLKKEKNSYCNNNTKTTCKKFKSFISMAHSTTCSITIDISQLPFRQKQVNMTWVPVYYNTASPLPLPQNP